MKKISHISIMITVILSLVSCDKEYPAIIAESTYQGAFIKNEGSISFIDESNSYELTADLFKVVNGSELEGELIDMSFIGSKFYVLNEVNGSQSIQQINAETFTLENTIDGFNNLVEIQTVSDAFVYAIQQSNNESESGSVVILEGDNLENQTTLPVGKNPTRIAYSRGKKAFVMNTGSENYTDSSVMVIDVTTKEVIDTIALEQIVEGNIEKLKTPEEMIIDAYQNIWVLCTGVNGNYSGIAKIAYGSHDVQVFPFEESFVGTGKYKLARSYNGLHVYFVYNGVFEMDISANKLPEERFISDDQYKNINYDAIKVNKYTGELYCIQDGAEGSNSTLYIFNIYGYTSEYSGIELGVKARDMQFVR